VFVKAKHVTRRIKVITRFPKEEFVGTGFSKDLFLPFFLLFLSFPTSTEPTSLLPKGFWSGEALSGSSSVEALL
jgi:hypothetical protein